MTAYRSEIMDIALQLDLDAYALEAQVLVESSGQTDAFRYEPGILWQLESGKLKPDFNWRALAPRRVAGSYGLLQVLYVTAKGLGLPGDEPEVLFVPRVGLLWGATYLRQLLTRYEHDLERALCAYNGGPGAVRERPYRTQVYADKVMAWRTMLRKES